ncbi:hypothetical protein [Pseudomonas sp. RIT-PI-S]|uniref:hypothetical protein n=1 Tax=Pseudomonas sp. RIT-PI-S TaxID=3035295 RepID=UPI0021D90633|nr:hypothetical protein [Pseudomonas sp. RIT-PI-S]
MNTEHDRQQPDAPVTDSEGKPVDVVERDIAEPNAHTEDVDKVITPTSIKRMEQDAETLENADEAVERQLRR